MSSLRVSAIISAYFASRFLPGRLDNLMEQTLVPEIVVICQAGTQEEYIARQFEIKNIITTPGIPTIYRAWNIGIVNSCGKYIVNANSDDLYTPDGLENMADILDENPDYAVVYGNYLRSSNYQETTNSRMNNRSGGFDELRRGYFVGPMPMWRRTLHEKYGLFDEEMRVAGDYEFCLRIAAQGEKFYHLDRIVGTYLNRADSAEHSNPIALKYETKLVQERYGKAVMA
jgi:glycosyltransferase involved in cell wall biosynthesis